MPFASKPGSLFARPVAALILPLTCCSLFLALSAPLIANPSDTASKVNHHQAVTRFRHRHPSGGKEPPCRARGGTHEISRRLRADSRHRSCRVVPGISGRCWTSSCAAGPGEVLVSGVIPPLVRGSRIEFTDRGVHELKGVPDRWPVLGVS